MSPPSSSPASWALLSMLLLACGGGSETPGTPDAGPDAGPDAPAPDAVVPTRPYFLASSGAHLSLDPEPGIRLVPADLASDADAVLIHQEFYGLPWDAFEAGVAPPAPWVAAMDQLAAHATSVGPVFLSLQLVSGPGRAHLADRAVIAGEALAGAQAGWSARCYDFATAADGAAKRTAYASYVDWMVRRFHPRWVNVAIEMNMFMVACPEAAWNALVDVERAAYAAAKAADPNVVAFPSIQIDLLYGWAGCSSGTDRDACFDASYARLANLARDRFAVTSFPYLFEGLRDPGALPADWFTRVGDRGGERTVIAETGWLAAPLVARLGDRCVPALPGSEEAQLVYFDRVIDAAARGRMDLVTWVSNRDLVPAAFMSDCPCAFDAAWCGFLDAFRQAAGASPDGQASAEYSLKQFGAMGLRHHDGTPRSTFFQRWQSLRAAASPAPFVP